MKLTRQQFDLMEERAITSLAARIAPVIVAEFGIIVADEIQPYEQHIRAGLKIGLDDDVMLYRFVRCLARVSEGKINGPRLTYVMQALMAADVPERRIARVEANIFAADKSQGWRNNVTRL